MATWLDPQYSDLHFVDDATTKEALLTKCRNKAASILPKKTTADDMDGLDIEVCGQKEDFDEVRSYEEHLEQKSPKFDLLGYWKSKSYVGPTLRTLHSDITPSSSAPSERSFSQCNLVLTAHRNRLTVEYARMHVECMIAVLRR